MHPSPAPLLPLGVLAALCLQGCAADCPPGSSLRPDGLCYLDGHDTAAPDAGTGGGGSGSGGTGGSGSGGTGDSGGGTGGTGGGDTGTPETWTTLPDACEAPGEPGEDPVFRQANFFVQGYTFAEIIDVDVDIGRGELWGAGQGGLMGVDVSDPFNLEYLADVAPSDWSTRAYQVHLGPYPALYGTHRDQGLVAYDRTDPRDPQERTWARASNLAGMDHDGDHLYVAGHDGALRTFDISDPLDPVLLDAAEGLTNGWVPRVAGDLIYVADNTAGIVVYDRSDPGAPTLLTEVATAGGAQDITLSDDGTTLYAAVGGAGVEVFSLADPRLPQSVGLLDLSYSAISVSADGSTLWAATQQDVVAIDIRTPQDPALIGTEQTVQWAMAVTAAGGRAYVGDWGYASVYGADLAKAGPDADPSTTELHIDQAGGTATLRISNLGNAPLSLLGARSPASPLQIEVTGDTVAPGESAKLRLTWPGDGSPLDTEVCLATDDPDEPLHRIAVKSGGSGEYLGMAAPDFALTGLDGQTYRLSEQIGHPVVLVYFATW